MILRWKKIIIICLICIFSISENTIAADVKEQQDSLLSGTIRAGETGQDSGSQAGQDDGEGTQGAADTGGSARLVIDNKNVYQGMKNSYARGYVPR